mmetsp:Transcript_42866/g.122603  ORF Transcript_42866/g.122603 Transcript_42866/m.122603 type:complete len:315 (-) Transcript_42866:24-968(-)
MGSSNAPILKGAGFSSASGPGFSGRQAANERRKVREGRGPKTAAIGHLPMRSGCSALYSKSPEAVCTRPKGSTYSCCCVTKATCTPLNGSMPKMAATAMSSLSPPAPPATKTNKLDRSAPFRIMSLAMPKKALYSASTSVGDSAGHEYRRALLPEASASRTNDCAQASASAAGEATTWSDENSAAPFGSGVRAMTLATSTPSEVDASWKYGTIGSASTDFGSSWNNESVPAGFPTTTSPDAGKGCCENVEHQAAFGLAHSTVRAARAGVFCTGILIKFWSTASNACGSTFAEPRGAAPPDNPAAKAQASGAHAP